MKPEDCMEYSLRRLIVRHVPSIIYTHGGLIDFPNLQFIHAESEISDTRDITFVLFVARSLAQEGRVLTVCDRVREIPTLIAELAEGVRFSVAVIDDRD